MRKKLLLLSFVMMAFSGPFALAQEVLSLEEAIRRGLESNYSLRVSRNQEQISHNNFTVGNAGFLPVIDLRGQYSGALNNQEQNLRDGTKTSTTGIHNTTATAGLSLGWNLFSGFRVQTTYSRLEELRNLGELNTRFAIENLIGRIASEYYYYVQQQQLMHNLQYAVDLSRERLRIDEERFLIGSGSKLQLLQSQVYLNADSSRLQRQYEVLRASRIRMNELLAHDELSAEYFLADTSITVLVLPDLDFLRQQTLEANTSLLMAASNQVLSELDMKIIRSRSYPYLNASSGYGYTYNTFGVANTRNQTTMGVSYGLTVGVNIFDGFNRQREKSNALIEVENREIILDRTRQEVLGDLLTIYNAYLNNLRLVNLELQNLEFARENQDIALDRYKLGALSGLELREVQKSLLDAEERLLSVQYQAKLAEISLMQLSGRILEYL